MSAASWRLLAVFLRRARLITLLALVSAITRRACARSSSTSTWSAPTSSALSSPNRSPGKRGSLPKTAWYGDLPLLVTELLIAWRAAVRIKSIPLAEVTAYSSINFSMVFLRTAFFLSIVPIRQWASAGITKRCVAADSTCSLKAPPKHLSSSHSITNGWPKGCSHVILIDS